MKDRYRTIALCALLALTLSSCGAQSPRTWEGCRSALGGVLALSAAVPDEGRTGGGTARPAAPSDETLDRPVSDPSPRWYEMYDLVAHAGGTSPNGNVGSNSLEAFEYNYQQGYRVFEGDLCLTSDGVLVLEHGWPTWCKKTGIPYTGNTIDYEQFRSTTYYGGAESPMDLPALMDLMIRQEDMWFMTDFKDCYDEAVVRTGFLQIVQAAQDAGRLDLLDRFIIQNHHDQFKRWVDEIYPFKEWLYTFYSIREEESKQPEHLISYCRQEEIPVITMWSYMPVAEWSALARPYGISIFVHTVNDPDTAGELIRAGASGIYTDSITPGQLTPEAPLGREL